MQGWVDLGGWLEMVYPHNGHPSWTNRARCWLTSLMQPTTLTTTPSSCYCCAFINTLMIIRIRTMKSCCSLCNKCSGFWRLGCGVIGRHWFHGVEWRPSSAVVTSFHEPQPAELVHEGHPGRRYSHTGLWQVFFYHHHHRYLVFVGKHYLHRNWTGSACN